MREQLSKSVTGELYSIEKSQDFYEKRYQTGYMEEWPKEKKKKIEEVIRSLDLPEVGEAIDFGCGNGVLTNLIKTILPKWKIFGSDLSETAIKNATSRYPECTFFVANDTRFKNKRFDFLFTNHVIEHVYNLNNVVRQMTELLKPKSAMLHFLPCGNPGSLEFRVCNLMKNGMNPKQENRFFFEDEGHVRRLTTTQLVDSFSLYGFSLKQQFYANQFYGAIDWISKSGFKFIKKFTDVDQAKDRRSRRKIYVIRVCLLALALVRHPKCLFDKSVKNLRSNPRDLGSILYIIFGWPIFLPSYVIDGYYSYRSFREWQTSKDLPHGSEMCIFLCRNE